MVRGSRAEVITPNDERFVLVNEAQQIGFVWLNALKASARNWNVNRSVALKFLNKPRSERQKPGKRTAPGRAEAIVVCPMGGVEKAAVLNHCANVCGAFAFGSPT